MQQRPILWCAWIAATLVMGCPQDPPRASSPGTSPAVRAPTGKVNLGHYHRRPKGAAAQGPVRWTDPEGTRWEVEAAYVVVSAVELHLCTPKLSWRHHLYDTLVPSAHAHVPDAATRLGTPFVETLTNKAGAARIVGEVAPPHGAYCALVVVVAPADADLMNDTPLDGAQLLGQSLIVQGSYQPDGSSAPTAFTLRSAARAHFTIPASHPRTGNAPLVLGPEADEVLVLLDKMIGPAIFAPLRASVLSQEATRDAAAREILRAFGASAAIYRSASP